jgi:UDP-N-acetylglucosamine 1-carboxyvinyltransferase
MTKKTVEKQTEEVIKVTGGTPLHGSVRIGGAKNASYKLLIAATLANTPDSSKAQSRLLNFSRISDVTLVSDIIEYLGGKTDRSCERAIFVEPTKMHDHFINPEHGEQGRFSTMFIPTLLHRFGKATVPAPGGDRIGKRSLERHFQGLEALGVKVEQKDGLFYATTSGLKGTTYRFEKNSHTGTETMLMAAVRAQGKTILENAAQEPEIDDMIKFLNNMGGRVERITPRTIRIEGVNELHGTIHKIIPDRNEAVSYACAAIATKGDVIIENARAEHLEAFLQTLEKIGAGFEIGDYGIRFFYKGELTATDITTSNEPGFMTDWQPLMATLLTQCKGTSILHETVMSKRFQYVPALQSMGADIEYHHVDVDDPDITYGFNAEELYQPSKSTQNSRIQVEGQPHPHAIKITGPSELTAGTYKIEDLRHGATLIMAAMIAKGTSTFTNLTQVDRGYEDLDIRLRSMGAKIERVQIK